MRKARNRRKKQITDSIWQTIGKGWTQIEAVVSNPEPPRRKRRIFSLIIGGTVGTFAFPHARDFLRRRMAKSYQQAYEAGRVESAGATGTPEAGISSRRPSPAAA